VGPRNRSPGLGEGPGTIGTIGTIGTLRESPEQNDLLWHVQNFHLWVMMSLCAHPHSEAALQIE